MIRIPVPEGFPMEGREDGGTFEMTITGRIVDGSIEVESVEGVEVSDEPEEEEAESTEMDTEALEAAIAGRTMQ